MKLNNIKRNVVKYAAHTVVGAVSANVTDIALGAVIRSEDEDTKDLIRTASNLTATGVVFATWGRVDNFVDRVADKRQARKIAKQEAKSE